MIEAYSNKPGKSNSVIAARAIAGKYHRFAKRLLGGSDFLFL
jgi:hypothetical protein